MSVSADPLGYADDRCTASKVLITKLVTDFTKLIIKSYKKMDAKVLLFAADYMAWWQNHKLCENTNSTDDTTRQYQLPKQQK